ncbi:MAG TPA: DHHA1 domain-containing protein, partial [Hyphomicrobium sp.]|nr:DHHA1 domain-containing protein [Hyphomicrobium sp.]
STNDAIEAARIAALLDRLNKERKTIETAALEEAMAIAEQQVDAEPDRAIVIVGSDAWHKGIVGLVASRLVDRFRRPACVIAWDKTADGRPGEGTGSLRSVAGVDLGAAVRAAVAEGLLVKGGGHAMAAGLTMKREKLAALDKFLTREMAAAASGARAAAALEIDAALMASGATVEVVNLLDAAGPYGQGNAQPRFVFPAHRVKFAKIVGDAHVRVVLEGGDGGRLEAIAFRAAGQPLGEVLMSAGGLPLHVAGHLRRDTWGGREKIELQIDDVADPRKAG